MGSGVEKVVVSSAYGTGAAMNIDTIGFSPRLVKIVNVASGGLCKLEWYKGMADAAAVKTATAGDITVLTTKGITPKAEGFTLGADTDVNVDGELFYYEAHE